MSSPSSSFSTLIRSLATTSLSEAGQVADRRRGSRGRSRGSRRASARPDWVIVSSRASVASIFGVLALIRRDRSSTWPMVDSTAGRIASLMSFRLPERLLEGRQHLAEPWARPCRPSAGPRRSCGSGGFARPGRGPTCSMIGSKNELSTPWIDCPGTSATADLPVDTMFTWLIPVSPGLMLDLHVLRAAS